VNVLIAHMDPSSFPVTHSELSRHVSNDMWREICQEPPFMIVEYFTILPLHPIKCCSHFPRNQIPFTLTNYI
jgi:hypothetical protein